MVQVVNDRTDLGGVEFGVVHQELDDGPPEVLGLERPTWKGVIGVGLSIVGVALVVLDGLTSGHASFVGDLLVLIAAFFHPRPRFSLPIGSGKSACSRES